MHGLRHSHAGHLRAANVHPKAVQELLERFPITLNREALWFYRFGRIFFGKPVATFPENAPGHSGIANTADIYSHVMPNMQAEAAAKIDAALEGAGHWKTGA